MFVSPRIRAVVLAGTLAASLPACSDSTSPAPTPQRVMSVAVTAPTNTLQIGESVAVSATPKNAAGQPLLDRPLRWSSTDETVLSVTSDGVATARAAGSAYVRASSEGQTGAVKIVVSAPPVQEPEEPESDVHSITFDVGVLAVAEGESRTVIATPRNALGEPTSAVVAWRSSDASIAVVSSTGDVRGIAFGTATLTAVAGGKEAQLLVVVTGTYAYELLFDRWKSTPVGMRPEVHRLDVNVPGMFPVRVIGISNAPPSPAISPDGNLIAHVCGQQSSICLSDRHGDFIMMLTGWGELADQPSWSPDGSRLAFRRWSAGGPPGVFNNADIWVMNADGTGKVNLTAGSPAGTSRSHPTWSPSQPDGSYRIAYAEESLAHGYLVSQLRSMRDDGSDRKDVTAPGEYLDVEPAWSPDGATIAFVRSGISWNSELFLVNAGGGSERPLLNATLGSEQRGPAWSPDGMMIAFASNHEIIGTYVTYQIYTVRPNGTDVIRRTSDNTEKQNPAWRKIGD